MEPFDDVDRKILVELQEDGRRPYRVIAQNIGLGAGTVRARIIRMTSSGLLDVVVRPNLYKMGFKFHALVAMKVEPGRSAEVAQLLESAEEITWVGLTATGYDLLVEVAMHDAQEFGRYKEDVLAHLPGFVSADVFVYWDLIKQHYKFAGGSARATVLDHSEDLDQIDESDESGSTNAP